MICGAFFVDAPTEVPILAALPPLFRIRAEEAMSGFAENVRLIADELRSERSASQLVLTRVADVITQVLRAYSLIRYLEEGAGFSPRCATSRF